MAGTGRDAQGLGDLIRALRLRAGLTQRQLATAANSSDSVVSRLERGQRLPARDTIERLDAALDAQGGVVVWWLAAIGAPGRAARPSRRWAHNYPASYHGVVWMRWSAPPNDDSSEAVVHLKWGRWRRVRRLTWPPKRTLSVWHTKGDDGLSIPVIVRADRPIIVEFHLGEPPADAIDINPGWTDEHD